MIESLLLVTAFGFLQQGSNFGDHLAAMACGLQNALATTYSGAVIRTTHITGIITDLGLAAGHFLRHDTIEPRQITIHLILVIGFIVGGIVGGLSYQQWGINVLLIPAAITGFAGASYTIYQHRYTAITPSK
jgi:uncharacterized membrane protein YoaK (UPF0700 family)